MKYLFDGKFIKHEDGYKMSIPFNVWEVTVKRAVIPAELKVEGKEVYCELLPLEKGQYDIVVKNEVVEGIDLNQSHEVLLRISQSLIKVNQDSPYNEEHPIRKIDHIDIMIQPEDGLCGQTCVAMMAGVSIEEAGKILGCREWQATMGMVISGLNYYGIKHSEVIVYRDKKPEKLPKCCIIMEKMGRFHHYLLHFDGHFYDSNLGILQDYDMSKLMGYLEVYID